MKKAYPAFLAVVILLIFSPSLTHDFVNWDDDVHLLNNPYVQTLDGKHIKNIFSTTVNKIYIPLTSLSFAIEYSLFGPDPFIYHLNNVLLHICVVVLVYFLACACGLSVLASVLAAVLFGVHPMHVESVAWITERKDVLYSFFYMSALLMYGNHVKRQNEHLKTGVRSFAAILALGILSLLSKPMAMSLPLILLLMDWFLRRKITRQAVFEKIYMIVLFVPIIYMTYALHQRTSDYNLVKSSLIWVWCLIFYPLKFIYPDYYVVLYHLPQPVEITNGPYALAVLLFLVLIISLIIFRKSRLYLFAVGFYFCSIFFLLRFDLQADANVVADRFMYLPSVGICMLIGSLLAALLEKFKDKSYIFVNLSAAYICLFGVLCYLSLTQIGVWKDSLSLWRHQLKFEPQVATALVYDKLAQGYVAHEDFDVNDVRQFEEAESYFKKSLAIKPDYANAFWGLGELYARASQYGKAEAIFMKALEISPRHSGVYFSLGRIYYANNENEKAAQAFQDAVQADPANTILRQKIEEVYD